LIDQRFVRDQRDFVLETERAPLLEEVHRVGADLAHEHDVRIERLNLRKIGTEVGRAVGRPKLLEDFAAVLREGLAETTGVLESECVRAGNRHRFAVTLLVRPYAGRMCRETRAPARDLDDIRTGRTLREIVSRDGRQEHRDPVLHEIRCDGQTFVGKIWTENHLRAVGFDRTLRHRVGALRIRTGVVRGADDFNVADSVVVLFPPQHPRVDHVVSRGCCETGLRSEHRDFDRLLGGACSAHSGR